jgi:hypothetical protein
MKLRWLLVVAVATALGGCVSEYFRKDPSASQLASGCQIIKCVCQKVRDSLLPQFHKSEPQDVLWRPDGTAYCPAGYNLERKQAPSLYDRPIY